MQLSEPQQMRRLRVWTAFFIFGLVVSGLTAIPLETELAMLERLAGQGSDGLAGWIHRVADALRETNAKFPFLAYGTDWLAFGHLVIAVVFIGAWRDPVRNKWLFQKLRCARWSCCGPSYVELPAPSSIVQL